MTVPGAWSLPPADIPGRGETGGFAERTRRNLDFIVKAHDQQHADVHVVTQVVLSLLGIVVFPFERLAARWQYNPSMTELEAAGWPRWRYADGSRPPRTLWNLVGHLRHATAHSNIAFSSNSRLLHEVVITFTNNPPHGKWKWEASIRGDELLTFCRLFLDHMQGLAD